MNGCLLASCVSKVILTESTIKKRELHKSFLDNISILKGLTDSERLAIADALTRVTFQGPRMNLFPRRRLTLISFKPTQLLYTLENENIIREGDAGNGFYILEEGEVECFKAGEKVGKLRSGAYFGEVALPA
jgi:CRP-like cAMP-binding protein